MEFKLNEDQRLIKETARELVSREIEPVMASHDRDVPLPKEVVLALHASLKSLGLMAPRLSVEDGGSGLGYLNYGLIMEELPASLGISVMAQEANITRIFMGADAKQKERLLPDLLDGRKILCSSISEPNVGSDPRGIETRARLEGDEVILDGTKLWITNGSISDVSIVVASLSNGRVEGNPITRIVVEREHSPYRTRDMEMIGLRQGHLSEVIFENCRVPAYNVLGTPGDAHGSLTYTWLANRPLLGLLAVGLARKALEACLSYVGVRKQFGRYIGKFQLVQEMLSEIATRIDASRLLCYRALSLMDDGQRTNRESSMAKWFATEQCLWALQLAMQIHGASGLTREVGIERLFRDARMLTIPDGTTQIQHLIVGKDLTGMAAFGG